MSCKTWIAMVMVAALLAGCKSEQKEPKAANPDFLPDDANRTLWRALELQSAEGAAEDGNLYDCHFETAGLSSLGRDKLDLMVRADRHPLVVYVEVLDSAAFNARQDAVTKFLTAAGMSSEDMLVKMGTNPDAKSTAAPNISRMWKTESPGRGGSEAGSNADTGMSSDTDTSGISPSFK